jgi:signal transduction histidine kinase/CheY-like chemotaxis protein
MHRILRPDGTIRWVVSSGRGIRNEQGELMTLIGGCLDVTDQRAIEERLRQTQKLEALGALTAGVAHNFNNMLAVILPFLEGALESPQCHAPELGSAALHSANRAAQMIRQLTTLAGGRPAGRKSVRNLTAVARAAAEICEQLFKGQLTIRVEGGDAAFPTLCDEASIEQTVVNLLLNARDALRDSVQPHPEISVQLRQVASRDVPAFPGRMHGNYAVIEVSDNGAGMDESTRARLFEPFFTTKGPDRGTGLGLATSHAIVREHGGFIFCSSRLGAGSTFSVYLPLAEHEPRTAGPESTAQPALEKMLRVLVVEDDAMVRRTTVALLKAGGHVVSEAPTPASALEQLQSSARFDAVLLDRSMPGGGGAPLVEAIRRIAPDVCLVYFTGGDVPEEEQARVDAVLYKPLGARDLLSMLDTVCRKRRPSSAAGREAS